MTQLGQSVGDEHLPVLAGARAWPAEGARVAIQTCALCGASLLIDPAHKVDVVELHRLWHIAVA
jgi:hypothetical protein